MTQKGPTRAAFAFIFVTVVLDMLALGVVIPVLPKLLEQLEGGNEASAARVLGFFAFVWALMQFVFAPLAGALSDRFGRRPVILMSNLGMGLDSVLMAVAPSLPWLFVGRLISGITAASIPTASAYIADVTPPEERAAKFGMLGAAFGLGFIVGPAFGGFLADYNLRLPFWASAALSLANFGYGFFVLPESLAPADRSPFQWKGANPLGSLRFLQSVPALGTLFLGSFLYFLAHESLPSVFVIYVGHRYGWTAKVCGAVLALVGICSTLMSALVVGPAVKALGERRAMLIGLSFGTLGFFIYGAAPTGLLFCVGVPMMSIWGLAGPSMQSLMSAQVPADAQGQLQGALASMRGTCGMVGPLLFTQIFALSVGEGALIPLPGAAYLLAAALLVCSIVCCARATPK